MLSDSGYDDGGVANYLVEGIKIVGHLERTGICSFGASCFVPQEPPPFRKSAKELQARLLQPRKSTEMDLVVWDKSWKRLGK
eukprot:12407603-Karenia_brevis.AAC.2